MEKIEITGRPGIFLLIFFKDFAEISLLLLPLLAFFLFLDAGS